MSSFVGLVKSLWRLQYRRIRSRSSQFWECTGYNDLCRIPLQRTPQYKDSESASSRVRVAAMDTSIGKISSKFWPHRTVPAPFVVLFQPRKGLSCSGKKVRGNGQDVISWCPSNNIPDLDTIGLLSSGIGRSPLVSIRVRILAALLLAHWTQGTCANALDAAMLITIEESRSNLVLTPALRPVSLHKIHVKTINVTSSHCQGARLPPLRRSFDHPMWSTISLFHLWGLPGYSFWFCLSPLRGSY